jgi:hypothetical protein
MFLADTSLLEDRDFFARVLRADPLDEAAAPDVARPR